MLAVRLMSVSTWVMLMPMLLQLLQLPVMGLLLLSALPGSSVTSLEETQEMVANTTLLLDELLTSYDRRLRPGFGGAATEVDVNLNIRSMGPISETDMAYQLDCYFRQSWVDTRLQFSGPLKILPVSVTILDRLWKPDTHFFNGKESYLHTITTPNKLLRIAQDGRILYSMRLTIKASCPMHLEKFPMDTQTCPLKFGSHGYSVTDMHYTWTHGPDSSIKMAGDMTLSQFDLISFPAGNDTVRKPGGLMYSRLYASFILRRHMGYFLINLYVPCSMLVVISWVGFWINREATADRIALGITTVLTMAFLGIDNRRDLPKVSYSTALDYFVGVCFAFVLASIIQFASVHFFTKHGSGEVFLVPNESDEDNDEDLEDNLTTTEMPEGAHLRFRERRVSFRTMASGYRHKMNGSTINRRSQLRTSLVLDHPNHDNHEEAVDDFNDRSHLDHHPPREFTNENCLMKFWQCLLGNADYRNMKMLQTPEGINSVSTIDRVSRILFPATFCTFQFFYWLSYLESGDEARRLLL